MGSIGRRLTCVALLLQESVPLRSPEVALVLASRFKFCLKSLLGATWDKTVHLDSFPALEPLQVLGLVISFLLDLMLKPGCESRLTSLADARPVIDEKTGGRSCGRNCCLFLIANGCCHAFKAASLTVNPSIVNAVVGCVSKISIPVATDLRDRFPVSIGPLPVILWSLLGPDAADRVFLRALSLVFLLPLASDRQLEVGGLVVDL